MIIKFSSSLTYNKIVIISINYIFSCTWQVSWGWRSYLTVRFPFIVFMSTAISGATLRGSFCLAFVWVSGTCNLFLEEVILLSNLSQVVVTYFILIWLQWQRDKHWVFYVYTCDSSYIFHQTKFWYNTYISLLWETIPGSLSPYVPWSPRDVILPMYYSWKCLKNRSRNS